MLSDSDFLLLLSQDKENLVALVIALNKELEDLRKERSLSLPEFPAHGYYLVRDNTGVRATYQEENVLISQVEVLAMLLSFESFSTVEFWLGEKNHVLSVWKDGKEVEWAL